MRSGNDRGNRAADDSRFEFLVTAVSYPLRFSVESTRAAKEVYAHVRWIRSREREART